MTDRLVLLLTNVWLTDRGGSETVVRDLALGLLRRGHRPIVYSPELGPPAEEMAASGVCVIDDLRQLAETPDIIHAHHAVPCGEALIRFPTTPAIYLCHSFSLWMEAPVDFPQIGAYVTVDEACRDRLVHADGIAPERVTIVRNAVDLRRIPPRPQPPWARPQRCWRSERRRRCRSRARRASGSALSTIRWAIASAAPLRIRNGSWSIAIWYSPAPARHSKRCVAAVPSSPAIFAVLRAW
jgi:hypothetical protein